MKLEKLIPLMYHYTLKKEHFFFDKCLKFDWCAIIEKSPDRVFDDPRKSGIIFSFSQLKTCYNTSSDPT